MGSSKSQTTGWRYYMGIHMGLGRGPMDELMEIRVGGRTAWKTRINYIPIPAIFGSGVLGYHQVADDTKVVTSSQRIKICAPMLFGGDEKEGGIEGTFDVMMGEDTQEPPAALATMLGGPVPGFRGMASAFFNGHICSNSPYPKEWKFRVRRTTSGWDGATWYPEKAVIWHGSGQGLDAIKAANPAHILYETYTNRDWGRGMAAERLDLASFIAAADKLHAEGFGLCLSWNRQSKLSEFQQVILDHIAGVCGTDLNTGKIRLKLLRDDYDAGTLPSFDYESGLLGIDEEQIASPADATNEMVVKWFDPVRKEERQTPPVQNLGAIQASGRRNSTVVEYPGVAWASLALRLAQRDLRAGSSNLKRFKLRLDRRGYVIQPGDVFRISAPDRGIENLVLRAGQVEEGAITSGTITVTAVVDVFGLPDASFVAQQPPTWSPPSVVPVAAEVRAVYEAPYFELVRNSDPANFALLDPLSGFVAAIARVPTSMSHDYTLITRTGGASYVERANASWVPTAIVAAATPPAQLSVVQLAEGTDLDFVDTGTVGLWDGEWVRVDDIDEATGLATLARGVADSVPAPHAAGSRIWFVDQLAGLDPTEWLVGETVNAKLLTNTASGTLDPAAAPVDSVTMAQRQHRPYPPGNVRLNGTAYPAQIGAAALLNVSWAHRDRVGQAEQLIDTAQSSIGPEAGTSYVLRIYGETDTLLRTQTQTGTTYTFTDELTVSGLWMDAALPVVVAAEDGEDALAGWACSYSGALLERVWLHEVFTDTGECVRSRLLTPGGGLANDLYSWAAFDSDGEQIFSASSLTRISRVLRNGDDFYIAGVRVYPFATPSTAQGLGVIRVRPFDSGATVLAQQTDFPAVDVIFSRDGYNPIDMAICAGSLWVAGRTGYLASTPFWKRLNLTTLAIEDEISAPGPFTQGAIASDGTHLYFFGDSDFLRKWNPVTDDYDWETDCTGLIPATANENAQVFLHGGYVYLCGGYKRAGVPGGKLFRFSLADGARDLAFEIDYLTRSDSGQHRASQALVRGDTLWLMGHEVAGTWFDQPIYDGSTTQLIDLTTGLESGPSLARIDSDAAVGTGCLAFTDPPAIGGACHMTVAGGFDWSTQAVYIEGRCKAVGGTDKPRMLALDDRETGVAGFGWELDVASDLVRCVRVDGGSTAAAFTLAHSLDAGTWYRVRLHVTRGASAYLRLYDNAGTLLAETTQAVTPPAATTRAGTGTATLSGVGRYDDLSWTRIQQQLRLNNRLRITLHSVRDGLDSLQQHNIEVFRGDIRITEDGDTRITEGGLTRLTE